MLIDYPSNAMRPNMELINNENIWTGSVEKLYERLNTQKLNLNIYFLVMVETPNAVIHFNNTPYSLERDDILILTPFNTKTVSQLLKTIEGKVIGFSEILYTDKEPSRQLLLNNIKKNHFLTNAFPSKVSIKKEHNLIVNIFDEIGKLLKALYQEPMDVDLHIVKNLMTTLLLIIQKRTISCSQPPQLGKTSTRNLAVQFIQLLDQYLLKEASLKFYIDKLSTTEATLKSQCKQTLGFPPKEVMQQKLIIEAKRHLLNNEIPVQEIAYHLGYTDPSNFNKFFQKRVGISPKEFRKNTSNTIQAGCIIP